MFESPVEKLEYTGLPTETRGLGVITAPGGLALAAETSIAAIAQKNRIRASTRRSSAAPWSHVAIVRGALSEPKIAVVDFNAILVGRAPDVRIEPRDIVYVPFSPYRTLERYAKLITDTFVRTVAANEAGHAVDSSFGGVSISNPLTK